jgi:hypothetical protein
VVAGLVDHLVGQLTEIVADGARGGGFGRGPRGIRRGPLHATARFHHRLHVAEWADPAIHEELIEVWKLLDRGLAARPGRS